VLDDQAAAGEPAAGGRTELLAQMPSAAPRTDGRLVRQQLRELGRVVERKVDDLARGLADVAAELGGSATVSRWALCLARRPSASIVTSSVSRYAGSNWPNVISRANDPGSDGTVCCHSWSALKTWSMGSSGSCRTTGSGAGRRAALHGAVRLMVKVPGTFRQLLQAAAEVLVGLVAAPALGTLEHEVAHAHPAFSVD
jgi:hypothetical protein